eukprot:6201438-Amphidinium_carterae.1
MGTKSCDPLFEVFACSNTLPFALSRTLNCLSCWSWFAAESNSGCNSQSRETPVGQMSKLNSGEDRKVCPPPQRSGYH